MLVFAEHFGYVLFSTTILCTDRSIIIVTINHFYYSFLSRLFCACAMRWLVYEPHIHTHTHISYDFTLVTLPILHIFDHIGSGQFQFQSCHMCFSHPFHPFFHFVVNVRQFENTISCRVLSWMKISCTLYYVRRLPPNSQRVIYYPDSNAISIFIITDSFPPLTYKTMG